MKTNINTMTNTILENRFIGKVQLTADDMGGVGCDNWNQYRVLCDNLAKAAYNHAIGREVDKQILGVCVAAAFNFFGVETVDSSKYHARILASMVERKPQTSQELKDARKAKIKAKKAWENAMAKFENFDDNTVVETIYEEKIDETKLTALELAAESGALQESEYFKEKGAKVLDLATTTIEKKITIGDLKADYEKACELVEQLYLEPNNYWFDLVPMLDKSKKHATAKARKALEDTCADIINERELMSAEELQAEAVRLADERKGRKLRKQAEEKAQANA